MSRSFLNSGTLIVIFFPLDHTHHRGYEIWVPLPSAPIADSLTLLAIVLGSKLFTGATIRPNFFSIFPFFFYFWIFPFGYSLLFLLSFSISSYSSLLILLFLSLLILLVGTILCLLTLLVLYFKLLIYTYPSFWGVFRGGISLFWSIWGATIRPNFFVLFFSSSLHISSYSSLQSYILPLLILLFLYLTDCYIYAY